MINNCLKYLFVILVSTLPCKGYGQYLNQVNQSDTVHDVFEMLNWDSGTLCGLGWTIDTTDIPTQLYKLTFRKYDANFNVTLETKYGDTIYGYYTTKSFEYFDGYFYANVIKTKLGVADSLWGGLVKIDTLGNVLWEKKYFMNYAKVKLLDLARKGDSLVMSAALIGAPNGNQEQQVLVSMDTSGNIGWIDYYSPSFYQYPRKLRATSDGGFILSSHYVANPNNKKPAILKLDSLGNVEWSNIVGGSVVDHALLFIGEKPDGGFLGYGFSEDPVSWRKRSWLVDLDQNGNILKDTIYDFSVGYDIFGVGAPIFYNNGFQLLGAIYEDQFSNNAMAYVTRIDSNYNVLWRHDYYQRNFQNALLHQWKIGGGFTMLGGIAYKDSPSNTTDQWFMIIDSNGCDVPLCNLGIDELNFSVDRKLMRIVDFMGRETEDVPNTPLIYIYSDGTTEKVFRVE